ncbi:ImcF-related family protein [Cupriavidus sp. BIS7]|uniref:ImcF-related family protein n=1 Tax=Cupriavidus sp. BIS7 TaxID=1217718 RepID=UPI000312EFC8|nr:ImcF-related family protein [Cupriavidus sp. BIS7]
MKKVRLDLVSILVLALIAAAIILLFGKHAGIKTAEQRVFWVSVVAVGAIALAFVGSLDRLGSWWEALGLLTKRLRLQGPEIASSTQASVLTGTDQRKTRTLPLGTLRMDLRRKYGLGWRYRQPWLLLVGQEADVSRVSPDLVTMGWLQTAEAVLLWREAGAEGLPDAAWLKQVYKLRRRRPVDAVVLVSDGEAAQTKANRGTHAIGIDLARIAEVLRWSAPVFLLDMAPGKPASASQLPVVGCEFSRDADEAAIEAALNALRSDLAQRYVVPPFDDDGKRQMGELSRYLDSRRAELAHSTAGLLRQGHPVRGIVFASCTPAGSGEKNSESNTNANLALWQHLGATAERHPGRRTNWHPITIGTSLVLCAVVLWTAGMLVSGLLNSRDIQQASHAIRSLHSAPNPATRLRALLALQHQIERYAYRAQQHAPWLNRFGLNRDKEVLAALWQPYEQGARALLIAPVQQDMEASLIDLAQLPVTALDAQTSRWAMGGHDSLKAYLMLADPGRAEPDFLGPALVRHWSTEARITPGEKQDLAERLFTFYAQHLKAHPGWKITTRAELVAGARLTLLAVIGERNAQDTVYRTIIDGVGSKYPDLTLAAMTSGTDTRGLLRSTASVPGVYTRQAYEGYVAEAIDEAAKRRAVAADWVLSGGEGAVPIAHSDDSGDTLRAALTQQYFADYAERWQGFMNAMQWEAAPTLPTAIDQLKLMADARQSPVIALMKSLAYHGGAGARQDSLSDALVAKAQGIFGKKDDAPEAIRPDPAGPLGAAFGPVLRLAGHVGQGATGGQGELSLQRFLDRATALRLRLQQVSNSGDGDVQARQMAQAWFQGKGSELADTEAYALLIAASLGTEWAGMGETLFVRPIAQATQTVLQPAQASLNDAWRQNIAMAWGRSFAGRYPFADTANDASLPELARFLRPQSGVIHAFLGTQLAGVLELQGDQWVPAAHGGRALPFDPAFLKGINALQRLATRMLAQGEAQYRFELKPVPTPGLTDTVLIVDDQKLHYYNQREVWQSMRWPVNNLQEPGTRLQWQAERAGTNKNYEFGGRWGLVRMLERAHVEPIDSATFQLTWQARPDTSGPGATESEGQAAASDPDSLTTRTAKAPVPSDMVYPVSYQMRTELGHGPLELLALRGFVLPSRIFADKRPAAGAMPSLRN